MKKFIAVGSLAVLGVVALASCKKDYTCTYAGAETTYTGLSKTQANAQETLCTLGGGAWAKK